MRRGRRAILLGAAGAALLAAPARDIDVGVPPGSPLEWSASFPAFTPPEAPLFPLTPVDEAAPDPDRTVARNRAAAPDVRFANAFGQVRILTWDIGIHLPWTQGSAAAPVTPRDGLRPPPPVHGEPLHWLALAPLLRLLLHPDALSRSETLAHVLEFGEAALPVLAAASGENDLAPACRELRGLIRVDVVGTPTAPRGATARESALARFVLEESLRDQPLDPTDDFGRRMFLFAEDVEPLLRTYAQHPSLELARNAVAGLGRYETRTAVEFLAAVAARTEDPVTLVRALAALGRFRGPLEVGPLVERLRRTSEPVQRAALIGALGRLGARDAAPLLLELGEQARKEEDSDLLISVLSALARIPAPRPAAELAALYARIAADARDLGERAKVTVQADLPDRPSLRAEILEQLALLARTQDPSDDRARAAVLALAKPGPLDPRTSEQGVGGTDPLGNLAACVRVLFLEGLQRAGPAGLEQLASLARRPELEPGLRGRALGLLTSDGRASLAATFLADAKEPVELRVHALELLILDRHPRIVDICRAQTTSPALARPRPEPGELFLALRALRHLSENGKLRAREVLPLYPFVQQPVAARLGLVKELEKRLAAFVNAARDGERVRELEERAGVIVDFVLENQMNALLERGMRDTRIDAMVDALGPAREPRSTPDLVAQLVPKLVALLLGGELDFQDPGRRLFRPSVPLAEEVLLALGRTREPLAVELLFSVLRGGASDLRAHAALALGMCAQRAVAGRLLPLLHDADPFVRFCASESLRHLTGKELAVDWMYGPQAERAAAAEELERLHQSAGR